jgi:hypothetical protein
MSLLCEPSRTDGQHERERAHLATLPELLLKGLLHRKYNLRLNTQGRIHRPWASRTSRSCPDCT